MNGNKPWTAYIGQAATVVTAVLALAGAYIYLEELKAWLVDERSSDVEWSVRETGEHHATNSLVQSVTKEQSKILQKLTAIDEKTNTLISQHERRFEELENGQKDIVNQIRDSSLGIAATITNLAYELGVYQGHHDNDIHPDTGTHP